jgi:ribosomal protein S12 methylthiotransferase
MPVDTAAERSVCLVSLGCSKNLVDSEVRAGHLGRAGLELVTDPEDSDLVIVNTCGFIDEAREESVDTILRYAELKREGVVQGLVVTGCLVELHEKQLAREIPEVDAFLPLSDYSGVPSVVNAVLGRRVGEAEATGAVDFSGGGAVREGSREAGGGSKGGAADLGRSLLTPVHTAYLRLGEGCNHVCAFCAIPKIRGKLASKPLDVLLEEARALVSLGTQELSLVSEDSTDYGKDLRAGYGLPELLRGLGGIDGLRWVRVLYAHPATFDEHLAETMAEVPNVLPYLDMPVQHGDATVLQRMRRGTSPDRIRRVVADVRAAMPDVTLRTTILVGFPGETERRFGHLLELLEELCFDRVGCFAYSPEPGTEGHDLGGRPSRKVAQQRREQVMRLSRERLQAANRNRVGRHETVLVDAVQDLAGMDGRLAIARSARDAPEIDGQVLVSLPADGSDAVEVGAFLDVKITGIKGYDLVGMLSE